MSDDGMSFNIDSAKVLRKMRALPEKLQKRGAGIAVRKGAAIVRKSAVANAMRFDRAATPAQVFKEIDVRTNSKLGKKEGGVAISVGVKGGAKRYVSNRKNRSAGRVGNNYEGPGRVFYWRFLEFGTAKMRAQPFMRPALEQNVDSATTAILAELDKQIDRLAKLP